MSLILDALRKSEGQRQRHAGPALATVPEASGRGGPARWILVLGVLLAVNAVLVLFLLLRSPQEPAQEALHQSAPAPATTSPASQPATEAVSLPPPVRAERQEVRPLATEVPPPKAASPPPATSGSASGGIAPAPEKIARAAPAPANSESQADKDARLPRMSELVVRGELNVPDMHVDIHVYSANPDERFVFINMRKYREGDATREGPTVERIAPAGVVMEYQGRRFMLPKD